MKFLITALVMAFSLPSFAGCTLSFEGADGLGMGDGFLGKKSSEKIVRILESKGYEVKTDRASRKTADYVLDVGTYYGYDCGTGLTWVDYLVLPAGYRVNLSVNHGNEIFSRERDFTLPPLGLKSVAKARLFRAVRAIPKCQ